MTQEEDRIARKLLDVTRRSDLVRVQGNDVYLDGFRIPTDGVVEVSARTVRDRRRRAPTPEAGGIAILRYLLQVQITSFDIQQGRPVNSGTIVSGSAQTSIYFSSGLSVLRFQPLPNLSDDAWEPISSETIQYTSPNTGLTDTATKYTFQSQALSAASQGVSEIVASSEFFLNVQVSGAGEIGLQGMPISTSVGFIQNTFRISQITDLDTTTAPTLVQFLVDDPTYYRDYNQQFRCTYRITLDGPLAASNPNVPEADVTCGEHPVYWVPATIREFTAPLD